MPGLIPVVKVNTLSPNMKITAFQLTPEEHADGKWHGAGIDDAQEGISETDFLQTLRKVSSRTAPPEPEG